MLERTGWLAALLAGLAVPGGAAGEPVSAPVDGSVNGGANGAGPTTAGAVPPAADFAARLPALLAAARAEGSNAALILFLARWPDTAEAEEARVALRARGRPDPRPDPGPDGTIVAAFDRARLAGPAALAAFAAAYPNHPLGLEAERPFWSE
jgi:hypothetical protein